MLQLLLLSARPIVEQLRLEEALLRSDSGNWCLIHHGSPPAIVMGISGKPELLIDEARLQAKPLPLIKRFSGGGTVIVDEETLFITFICNSNFTSVACCPTKVMRWTEELYRPLFEGLDFRLLENDYVIGNRKCGGNAQHLCKQRWLHHSSFLWDFLSSRMHYLKMPPRMPGYRQQRPHDEFLCRLNELFPSKEAFTKRLVDHLKNRFDLVITGEAEALRYLTEPHRKSTIILN